MQSAAVGGSGCYPIATGNLGLSRFQYLVRVLKVDFPSRGDGNGVCRMYAGSHDLCCTDALVPRRAYGTENTAQERR